MPPQQHAQPSRENTPDARDAEGAGNPATSQSDWWQRGIVYQIYPRSFADASGDGIGDLAGITEHLDHVGGGPESLGVDAIWLSPIYPSPDFDFGYDVADYVGIDPKFGTLADFDRLVDAAHRRGIRIILDLVLNHASSRHPWFQASRSSRTGPYADWFIWRDSPGRTLFGKRRPPNNWRSWFGGSAWTWDERREQFYLHTFLPEQPDLNWRNPAVREALLDVARTWLERGVDGFRLDVFNAFFKDVQLRSNPWRIGRRGAWTWQRHLYDRNQPEMDALLRDLRAMVDARPGRMTVGELFDGSFAEAARYIAPRHLVFDWAFIQLPWSAAAFRRSIAARDAALGPERWPANVLSNHDQPRQASRYGDGLPAAVGDARAKVAAALLLTLRGTPFLYYGEELGLRNLKIPNSQAFDPPARRSSWLFPWWNRDQARGPMPWRPGPGAGFSTADPWLPLPPDAGTRNVAAQSADPGSILSWYRRLIALRGVTPALQVGSQALHDVGPEDVLAYTRDAVGGGDAGAGRESHAFVALNFGDPRATISVPAAPGGGAWRLALSTHRGADGHALPSRVELAPLEALVAVSP
ncbi:MAG TPA: alpha-glucosidase [Candidatus Binatia bacterium]|nr:alpha-glucosidase [Candidatus Binatia bacterium]